jgi:hypothetical protein
MATSQSPTMHEARCVCIATALYGALETWCCMPNVYGALETWCCMPNVYRAGLKPPCLRFNSMPLGGECPLSYYPAHLCAVTPREGPIQLDCAGVQDVVVKRSTGACRASLLVGWRVLGSAWVALDERHYQFHHRRRWRRWRRWRG